MGKHLFVLIIILTSLFVAMQGRAVKPLESRATNRATKLVASPQVVAARVTTARVLQAVGVAPLPQQSSSGDGVCDYQLVRHLIEPATEADGDVCYPISGQAELVYNRSVWTSQASETPLGPRFTINHDPDTFWEAWITEAQQHNGNDDTIGIGIPDPAHPGEWLWNRVLFSLYDANGKQTRQVWAPLGISRCAGSLDCAAFWAANGLERRT